MNRWNYKVFLAVIIGEICLILLTTLAQEVIVDGVSLESSSYSDLLLGGGFTLIAGFVSGVVATRIANKSIIPITIISALIVIETSYLIVSNRITNPIWFDVLSALALISSVGFGYIYVKKSI